MHHRGGCCIVSVVMHVGGRGCFRTFGAPPSLSRFSLSDPSSPPLMVTQRHCPRDVTAWCPFHHSERRLCGGEVHFRTFVSPPSLIGSFSSDFSSPASAVTQRHCPCDVTIWRPFHLFLGIFKDKARSPWDVGSIFLSPRFFLGFL